MVVSYFLFYHLTYLFQEGENVHLPSCLTFMCDSAELWPLPCWKCYRLPPWHGAGPDTNIAFMKQSNVFLFFFPPFRWFDWTKTGKQKVLELPERVRVAFCSEKLPLQFKKYGRPTLLTLCIICKLDFLFFFAAVWLNCTSCCSDLFEVKRPTVLGKIVP